jgi:RNA polymerase sigma-70 factor, ECF subfamily
MTRTTGEADDAALCSRLAVDIDGGLEALVLAYQNRIYRFALRFCANAQDAEEITQDAFVRAYNALKTYAPERITAMALRPWLYRITINVARNRTRRKVLPIADDVAGDLTGDVDETSAALTIAPAGEPDVMAERSQDRQRLAVALAALPGRYREAIILRYIEDLSYEDAAAALGRPAGTIKSDVHRGLARLRAIMGETE